MIERTAEDVARFDADMRRIHQTQTRVRAVISDQWYRVDKADGTLLAVNALTVARAAADAYREPVAVVSGGRFQTTFAIYSQGKHLTENERVVS